jgi:hypothetical protein
MAEQTALQPRPRRQPTRPAQPDHVPNRCAHEDKRAGALKLCAAFDTRSGRVSGDCAERKRQQEGIALLEQLARESAPTITTIPVVCDHVRTHHGQEVRRW